MKEDKFKYWYKKKIEESEEMPPEAVWENIQDQLDIENTWDNIKEELDREDKVIVLRKASYTLAAAAAILLLILILMPPKLEQRSTSPITETTNPYINIQNSETGNQPVHSTDNETDEKLTANIIDQFNRKSNVLNEPGFTKSEKDREQPAKEYIAEFLNSYPVSLPVEKNPKGNLQSSSQKNINKASIPEEEVMENNKPEYFVGTSGNFTNSWLLSNKTMNSIRNSPYSSANPQRNNSFSLFGGVNLNERLSLQLEALIEKSNGQNYKEYLNGKFINNQIQLNYSALQLAGKYKFIKEGKNIPVSHNLVFGVYASYLNNANQSINDEEENIRNRYKNYDLGALFGYEIDSKLSHNLILSTGVRIDPGLINIYTGSEDIPSEFNKTYTTSLSLQVSLKYNLY
ncbi:MAG: outer membrane beta-barrel protein [Bacteroidales bacterium]